MRYIIVLVLFPILTLADSLTVSGPGFTHHGVLTNTQYRRMKHRIGLKAVVHPIELGLTYKSEYLQAGAIYLKDCWNNHAGMTFIGTKVDFLTYFALGGVVGLYAREHINQSDIPLVKTIGIVDIIPIGGATLSVNVPLTDKVGLEVNTLSNFYITHSNIGLKFSF